MDYPLDGSDETELGRVGDLHGPIMRIELVFTNNKIVQIDHEDETLRRWAGRIVSVVAWFLVLLIIGNLLFTFLGWIVDVIGFGLLPVFIVLIPRYIAKKTELIISSVSREQVEEVVVRKRGIDTKRGSFLVNLANDRFAAFGPYGEAAFEKAFSMIQEFCNLSPVVPLNLQLIPENVPLSPEAKETASRSRL
jgi:hypothetical protein